MLPYILRKRIIICSIIVALIIIVVAVLYNLSFISQNEATGVVIFAYSFFVGYAVGVSVTSEYYERR